MNNNTKLASGKIDIGDIYWFDHHLYYAFNITFSETSSHQFYNLVANSTGFKLKSEKLLAKGMLENLKCTMEHYGIKSGEKVAILFDSSSGMVIAFAGNESNVWIDAKTFKPKNFDEFNINSLEVLI